MTDDEFIQFTQRFEEYSIRNKMSHQSFKESLGILAIDSLSFLSDRMFKVMDRDHDGLINLEDYLNYFDTMLHGSKHEKMMQSFELLDIRGNQHIKLDDFRSIVQSFAQMWSAALGHPSKHQYCNYF
jgi:Ca2+-binding EF-hand superfamily protein